MRQWKMWAMYVAAQLLVVAMILGALELGLRARIGRMPSPTVPSGVAVPAYYNAPGVVVPKDPFDLTIKHTFNSQGFRGPELSPRRPRLLMLGDSVMQGVIVRDDQTLPALMQKALPDWDVVNGGVSGYDMWDYEGFFKRRGAALKPDVVVLGIYVNDNTRAAGQIQGAPQPAGLRGSALVKTIMYAAARRWNKGSPFAFSKKVSAAERARMRELVGDESAAALERFLADYKYAAGPMILDWLPRMLDMGAWDKAGEPLRRLAKQTKLVAVVFPAQFEVYPGYTHPEPHAKIASLLKKAGVPFVDVTEAFRREGGDELYPLRSDTSHPGPKGYEIAARELAALLR